ncbi:MAG TPA: GntR family transcriptional regulator [Bacillales bacterium]|nr:GntR family transcriptional regulator [Bacillales bacterium]
MKKQDYGIRSVPRTFEQVASQIVDYISDENLRKGDKLPPERKLCELLEVSRSSVREGLRVLELLRYLDSRQGGGTFVGEAPPYLLPAQILNQKIKTEDLNHYFEVGLMAAEKIIISSLGTPVDPKELTEKPFWPAFDAFVSHLGKQLVNSYYATLWSDTYDLLQDNDYFLDKNVTFSASDLIESFNQEDRESLDKKLKETEPK